MSDLLILIFTDMFFLTFIDEEKGYYCEQCPQKFSRFKGLQDHRFRIHTLATTTTDDEVKTTFSKKFKCSLCPSTFINQDSLDGHIRKVHKSNCNDCFNYIYINC